jgi:hypothetical protein
MKNPLDFDIPFNSNMNTDFINCFASVYLFLEKVNCGKNYRCNNDNKVCDGCGCCDRPNEQARVYFLFSAMSGRSATRDRCDGQLSKSVKLVAADDSGTDYTVDFLFGFAGYEYRKCSDKTKFKDEITASIDAGKPVIAQVRSKVGRFRVIIGYDGDVLINPDYAHARDIPESALLYEEIEKLYIIGDKVSARFTLKDGLERIKYVMESHTDEALWDEHINSYEELDNLDPEEIKARLKYLIKMTCQPWNCHDFKAAFRNCYDEEMRNPVFSALWERICELCDSTFSCCLDISKIKYSNGWYEDNNPAAALEAKTTMCVTIEKIKENDLEILEIIKQALEIVTWH